jgi:predicted ATPase
LTAAAVNRRSRAGPEEKRVLQAASVAGREVSLELLDAIVDPSPSDLRQSLARLQAAEFLYETKLFPEVEYTFKHALTHEVAYEGLLYEHRRTLHARIITVIEELCRDRLSEHLARLAHHAVRGEVWQKAVSYLREAGVKALGAFGVP